MALKRRTRLIILTVIAAIGVLAWVFTPNNSARLKAQRTRASLRQHGFKTELSDFDFSLDPERRARADIILTGGQAFRDIILNRGMELFHPVGTNAAIALAKEEALATDYSTNAWPIFRVNLDPHQAVLDEACAALISGAVRFEPPKGPNGDLMTGYVVDVRSLSAAMAARSLLELHENRLDPAWTNLLALTRLATEWNTEPLEIAFFIKYNCLTIATRATWQALQAHSLTTTQLATLAREWDRANLFKGLPETAEFSCAAVLIACKAERERPPSTSPSLRQAAADLFMSPGRAWSEATWEWRESRYRNFGSYEDENAGMAFYRAREHDFREASNATCWAQLRLIPGITNPAAYQASFSSRIQGFAGQRGNGAGFFQRQRNLVTRAVEAETRRRLVRTAIALENFHLAHNSYPESLADLAPGFIPPTDFMDGKPLRYQTFGGKTFLLYSTGLDCVDDGGQILPDSTTIAGAGRGFFRTEGPDLIWPRPASAPEVQTEREAQELARADSTRLMVPPRPNFERPHR
jgi:hypothetical protein